MSKKILVIPDTQVTPGVPLDHLNWVGKYIVEQQPDIIVHLGDHYDMHSLSSYDMGKKAAEGARVADDILSGNIALAKLMKPIEKYNAKRKQFKEKQYRPRKVALIGNHEERMMRHVNEHPELEGLLTYDLFDWKKYGFEVHNFLEVVNIEGIRFSHFFANPGTGRPYAGMMETRIKNIGFSFIQGHQQGLKTGMRELGDGTIQRGIVSGSCYLHNEHYRGPQAAYEWRGVLVLHEVFDGDFDLMEVSLTYLCRTYEGMALSDFIKQKYSESFKWRKH